MGKNIAIVLAAGLGTRMKSKKPKVLHELCGVPMIRYVINALKEADIKDIIVVLGYGGEEVEKVLENDCRVVYQTERLGTGHAVMQALPELQANDGGNCLVLCGDTPLLQAATLRLLWEKHMKTKAQATVLTAELSDPSGYGRVIKGAQGLERIVEEKDANDKEKAVNEVNTGTYCFSVTELNEKLKKLTPVNAQGEYYLTDVVRLLAEDGKRVETLLLENPADAQGINNRLQLAEAEKVWRQRIIKGHMLEGVTVINPENTYIDATVQIGQDTVIYPGVILQGKTVIGENCIIGPNTRIVDSRLGDRVKVDYSYIVEAKLAADCTVGPFSYLRSGTELSPRVKIGGFVEVKKTQVGEDSKIPHLSYVGDSIIGKDVNIGAGTITCNYDGNSKNITEIEDGAFVGSNTNLVAPLKVGKGAYIGAGSTVTKNIPDGALAIARGRQKNIANWKSKEK